MNFLQAKVDLKKSESDLQIIESEFEKVKVNLRKPIEARVHPDPIPHYLRSSHIFYLGCGIPQNQFYVTHKWGLIRQHNCFPFFWKKNDVHLPQLISVAHAANGVSVIYFNWEELFLVE